MDLLSFFSAASGNAQPISPADAEKVARAQYKAMAQAPGGAAAAVSGAPSKKGVSVGTIVAAVFVVAVLALAVATPALLRRRRAGQDAAAATVPATLRQAVLAAMRFTISANRAGEVTGNRWPESTRMTSTGGRSLRTIVSCISGRIGRSRSFST